VGEVADLRRAGRWLTHPNRGALRVVPYRPSRVVDLVAFPEVCTICRTRFSTARTRGCTQSRRPWRH